MRLACSVGLQQPGLCWVLLGAAGLPADRYHNFLGGKALAPALKGRLLEMALQLQHDESLDEQVACSSAGWMHDECLKGGLWRAEVLTELCWLLDSIAGGELLAPDAMAMGLHELVVVGLQEDSRTAAQAGSSTSTSAGTNMGGGGSSTLFGRQAAEQLETCREAAMHLLMRVCANQHDMVRGCPEQQAVQRGLQQAEQLCTLLEPAAHHALLSGNAQEMWHRDLEDRVLSCFRMSELSAGGSVRWVNSGMLQAAVSIKGETPQAAVFLCAACIVQQHSRH